MRYFTLGDLRKYDGVDGRPAYVGYMGKVYDITNSDSWDAGTHYEHYAGEDLTEQMAEAPHGDEVFKVFPIVGELGME